jgi:serine/threonine protein kinase
MAGNITAGSEIPLSGLRLADRYELSDEMPSGALCRIVRGDDLTLRRPVVVKAIPAEHAEMYLAALRATSALTHPAAVTVYDTIHESGWFFLVQEAISGQALSRYLRQGVPSERAVNLTLQLARALSYTHHRDMVHGDLTPAAVLVDRHATVRVNNFGLPPDLDYFLAEGGADAQQLIAEGTTAGDVLALGLLLRQMLSSAALGGAEPGQRPLRPEIPDDLARLVTRCTSPSASDAITDATALAIVLEAFESHLAPAGDASALDTPPILRAMYDAETDQALWAVEETNIRQQVYSQPPDHASHELGSRFNRITNPGHTDDADSRATDEAALAMPPRLRLPTRSLPQQMPYPDGGTQPAYRRDDAEDGSAEPHGVTLSGIVVAGVILFIIFFLIGFLGPFLLAGR